MGAAESTSLFTSSLNLTNCSNFLMLLLVDKKILTNAKRCPHYHRWISSQEFPSIRSEWYVWLQYLTVIKLWLKELLQWHSQCLECRWYVPKNFTRNIKELWGMRDISLRKKKKSFWCIEPIEISFNLTSSLVDENSWKHQVQLGKILWGLLRFYWKKEEVKSPFLAFSFYIKMRVSGILHVF